jgi:signal transduction histidine kinase
MSRIWLTLVLFCWCATASAMLSAPLNNPELRLSLGPYTAYVEDPSGSLSAEQVNALADSRFTRVQGVHTNLGKNDSIWWLKVSLNNLQPQALAGYLEINYPLLDHLQVFVQSADRAWQMQESGDRYVFAQRPVQVRNFWFPLQVPPGDTTVLIRVQTTSTLFVPLYFSTYLASAAAHEGLNLFNGAFYGVLFAMFCYNLFLYLSLRESAYFWYLVYNFSAVLMGLSYDGLLFKLLPNQVLLEALSTHGLMYLLCLSAIQFSRHFLHTQQHFPRADACLRLLMLLSALGLVSLPLISYTSWSILASLTVSVVSLSLIICGLYVWRCGLRYGSYYSVAWAVLLCAFFQATAGSLGFETLGAYNDTVVRIGVIIELITLSIGLADRINSLKEEGFQSRQAAELAASDSQAKSRFLAKMSHEIRTPLNGVLGMLQLLKETPLNHSQRFYVDTIASSGGSLIKVINDILDYARIESGKLSLEYIEFDLEELISETFSLFTAQALDKHLALYISLESGIPRYVHGDPTRLKQVLLNLLSNALKFTAVGHVALNVSRRSDAEGQLHLVFAVSDSGIGINDQALDKLFESFAQGDSSTTRRYGGSGLGLAISKELVEMMGGRIEVQSTPNQGSRFVFSVPNAIKSLASDPLYELLKGRTALLSSLDGLGLDALSRLLGRWGMRTERCQNPDALRSYLEEFAIPPLLVLMAPWPGPITSWLDGVRPLLQAQQRVLLLCSPEQSQHLPEAEQLQLLALPQPLAINALRVALHQLYTQSTPSTANAPSQQRLSGTEPPSILVAEDNSVNQLVVQGLLKKRGYSVRLVSNGLAALYEYQRDPSATQLILMDCEMPKMDGFEATRQIRRFEQQLNLSAVPIIALTAHILDEHRQHSRESGMNDFLGKPLDSAKLYHTLDAYLPPPTA